MKRVKNACICQTLHFMPEDDFGHEYTMKLVKEEGRKHKASPDKKRMKYRIVNDKTRSDGSVMIKIVKRYRTSPADDIRSDKQNNVTIQYSVWPLA